MRIGIIVAMEEEFQALNSIFQEKLEEDNFYKIYSANYKNNGKSVEIFGIISKIGKSASASATTHLINKYNPDFLINMGSCGGLNNSSVSSIILSKSAGYCDVDVQAFGYKLGQLPQQPEFFESQDKTLNFTKLLDFVKKQHSVLSGFVVTADSFIADPNRVEIIKNIYPNTLAVEMEGASFAQVCNTYGKDFLLVKKVSDMADTDATKSFKDEINKMSENTTDIIKSVLDYLSA